MSNIWEEFDNAFDTEALQDDVKAASENNTEFKEVPNGVYEVKIEKLELGKTKNGDPKTVAWCKILDDGPVKNQLMFVNQMMNTGYGIHFASELLRSFDTGIDVKFENFSQWNNLLMDIKEKIDSAGLEYSIEKGTNDKGYDQYTVKEVFESDGPSEAQLKAVEEDEDIPIA